MSKISKNLYICFIQHGLWPWPSPVEVCGSHKVAVLELETSSSMMGSSFFFLGLGA
jgi:hypothetical protein